MSKKTILKIFCLFLSFKVSVLGAKCSEKIQNADLLERVLVVEPSDYLRQLNAKFHNGPVEVDGEPQIEYSVVDSSGRRQMADIRFTADKDIFIKWMYTHESERGKFLGTAIARQIASDFSQLNTVRGNMVLDNRDSFLQTYKSTGDLEAAVKATPFYKIMASAGFKNIDFLRSRLLVKYNEHIHVVLTK